MRLSSFVFFDFTRSNSSLFLSIFTIFSPLSAIGMPYYSDPLLSTWPPTLFHHVGRPPPIIPPEVLAKVKYVDFVGYSSNPDPLIFRRNRTHVISTRVRERRDHQDVPKFVSEQERERLYGGRKKKEESKGKMNRGGSGSKSHRDSVPKFYRRVEIKYSKFGVEDFDFG